MTRIIVVGGGPAGLMSAFFAANNNCDILLLEKNEKLGKKLYITGKGRCNVTNEKCVGQDFLNNVVSNPKFLYSASSAFDYDDTVNFFEKFGCKLKVERGGRVFPVSDKASDITKALTMAVKQKGVKVQLDTYVVSIEKKGETFEVQTNKGLFVCDKLILTTGGKSYPTTGSTGEGYEFAKSFGHNIIPAKPSLVAIPLKGAYVASLEGLSLKNVELRLVGKKTKLAFFGEGLFTDKELSGPIALSMSAHIAHLDNALEHKLFLDFKPYMTQSELEERLLNEFEQNKNSDVQTVLKTMLPARFVPVLLDVCEIAPNQKVHSVTKSQRLSIAFAMKNFELKYEVSKDFERAVVTTGGVDTKEINSKTMESKLCPGLFFAGEIIDVDAYTGGFNIQIALSTGCLAGRSAGGES